MKFNKIRKTLYLFLLVILFFTLIGCSTEKQNNENSKEQVESSIEDVTKQYDEIKQDFIAIKSDMSFENIERITGIKPITILDGVEERDFIKYEYKFDYGFSYEAYIKFYSNRLNNLETTYVELICPDDFFVNLGLNLSEVTKEEFTKKIDKGMKVLEVNNLAGGDGFVSKYKKSTVTNLWEANSIIWADNKGNYIKATLKSGETVDLSDKALSYVFYTLNQ